MLLPARNLFTGGANCLRFICVFIGFFFSDPPIAAAQEIKLYGHLLNPGKAPIEFATVSLWGNQQYIAAALSDSSGYFSITAMVKEWNKLTLRISLTGYETKNIVISLPLQNGVMNTGGITLSPVSISHEEATVWQQRKMFERRPDRLVYNLANRASTAGSTLWDEVLRLPGVQSDGLNNLLHLNKPAAVYMNDRPLPLSGEDLYNYLHSIPVNNIIRIELITNPSSRYDAAGGVLINIVTAKRSAGIYGSAQSAFEQSTVSRLRNSIDLNMQGKKAGLFLRYNRSDLNNLTTGREETWYIASNRTSFWNDRYRRLDQITRNGYQATLDLFLSPKTTLSADYNGLTSATQYRRHYFYMVSQPGRPVDSMVKTFNTGRNYYFNHFANINLNIKLDSNGRHLAVYGDRTWYRNRRTQFAGEEIFNSYNVKLRDGSRYSSRNIQDIGISSVSVDYRSPFKKMNMETGLKYALTRTDNTLGYEDNGAALFIADSNRSNHYRFTEKNHAAYFSLSGKWKNTEYQAGLRYEYTETKSESVTNGQTNNNAYHNLFPTLYIQYNRKNSSFNISYSRRINRPEYWRLNPFRFFPSPYQSIVGNPFMVPSIINRAEFSYQLNSGLNISVYYNMARNSFQQLSFQDTLRNTLTYYSVNFGTQKEYGIYSNYNKMFTKWWDVNLFAQLVRQQHQSSYLGSVINNKATRWSVSVNNHFTLSQKHTLTAELSGWYYSRAVQGLFIHGATGDVSVAIKKQLFNKKVTAALAVNDMFFSRSNWGRVDYGLQQFRFIEWYDPRQVRLSLSYKFGKKKQDAKTTEHRKSGEHERGRI